MSGGRVRPTVVIGMLSQDPINLEVIYFFADSIFGTSFLEVAGRKWLLRVKICFESVWLS